MGLGRLSVLGGAGYTCLVVGSWNINIGYTSLLFISLEEPCENLNGIMIFI